MLERVKLLITSLIIVLFVSTSLCITTDGDSGDEEEEEIVPVIKYGTLSSDETWSGVIKIEEWVSVPEGVTLTIEPGTKIYFKHYRGYKEPSKKPNLMVKGGTIRALGGEGSVIWFTSDAEDPINGDWIGISIRNSQSSVFRYVIVEFSTLGILQMDSAVEVSHSIIRWTNSEGLYAERSKPVFKSNILYGNGYHDIALEQFNTEVDISGNHFLGGHVSLHFEKTEAVVKDNYFIGYRKPITGGMDSVVTIKDNRFRDFASANPIGLDATVVSTISGNDMGDDSVPIPPLDISDIRDKELDYMPGDPQDRYNYVYDPDDETRSVMRRYGKGLSFGWSLLCVDDHLYRFSLGKGTIGKQLDFIRLDMEMGVPTRYGNDVIMNPRGLTHDGEFFYVNDFSLLKVFKFRINGTYIEILNSFDIPDKNLGGTTGLTYDGQYLNLMSRDGKTLQKIDKNGTLVNKMTFSGGMSVGTLVWTGEHYWTVSGGPKGLGKWDAGGNLVGTIYPVADGTWAITWDGNNLWTLQRTCEEWDDDKIFGIEILDDSLGVDVPPE